MKIEFTNEHRTTAIITRGWFRKERAEVHLRGESWYFVVNNAYVGEKLTWYLDLARDRAHQRSPWVRVVKMPRAKLLP